jgi:AcrR family transcriptional regulator
MHTVSMTVKDKRVAQGEATRAALVAAARELFGADGFAATSTEEVVARAGVTKGALYHHFNGKEDLFRAVFEQVQREVSDKAVAAFLQPDSWEALLDGCGLWIDAHLDPPVRRIVLREARAVLGWEDVRAIENRFGAVALRGALRKAMHAGDLEPQPLRPLALLLIGALGEACQYVADAENPTAARAEVGALIARLLSAFRAQPVGVPKSRRRTTAS